MKDEVGIVVWPQAIRCSTYQEEINMRLNPPRQVTWLLALALGAVGVAGAAVSIPIVSANAIWFVVAGLVLMLLATLLKGL